MTPRQRKLSETAAAKRKRPYKWKDASKPSPIPNRSFRLPPAAMAAIEANRRGRTRVDSLVEMIEAFRAD